MSSLPENMEMCGGLASFPRLAASTTNHPNHVHGENNDNTMLHEVSVKVLGLKSLVTQGASSSVRVVAALMKEGQVSAKTSLSTEFASLQEDDKEDSMSMAVWEDKETADATLFFDADLQISQLGTFAKQETDLIIGVVDTSVHDKTLLVTPVGVASLRIKAMGDVNRTTQLVPVLQVQQSDDHRIPFFRVENPQYHANNNLSSAPNSSMRTGRFASKMLFKQRRRKSSSSASRSPQLLVQSGEEDSKSLISEHQQETQGRSDQIYVKLESGILLVEVSWKRKEHDLEAILDMAGLKMENNMNNNDSSASLNKNKIDHKELMTRAREAGSLLNQDHHHYHHHQHRHHREVLPRETPPRQKPPPPPRSSATSTTTNHKRVTKNLLVEAIPQEMQRVIHHNSSMMTTSAQSVSHSVDISTYSRMQRSVVSSKTCTSQQTLPASNCRQAPNARSSSKSRETVVDVQGPATEEATHSDYEVSHEKKKNRFWVVPLKALKSLPLKALKRRFPKKASPALEPVPSAVDIMPRDGTDSLSSNPNITSSFDDAHGTPQSSSFADSPNKASLKGSPTHSKRSPNSGEDNENVSNLETVGRIDSKVSDAFTTLDDANEEPFDDDFPTETTTPPPPQVHRFVKKDDPFDVLSLTGSLPGEVAFGDQSIGNSTITMIKALKQEPDPETQKSWLSFLTDCSNMFDGEDPANRPGLEGYDSILEEDDDHTLATLDTIDTFLKNKARSSGTDNTATWWADGDGGYNFSQESDILGPGVRPDVWDDELTFIPQPTDVVWTELYKGCGVRAAEELTDGLVLLPENLMKFFRQQGVPKIPGLPQMEASSHSSGEDRSEDSNSLKEDIQMLPFPTDGASSAHSSPKSFRITVSSTP